MQIIDHSKVDPNEWDAFSETSPDAWLHHLSAWMLLERKYWFPQSHSFMIRSETGAPLGILPLYVSELGLSRCVEKLLHSGMHRHTGLATAPSLKRKELKRVQEFAMREVFRVAREVGADRIQLNAQNLAPANLPPLREEIPFFVDDFHFFFGLHLDSIGGGVDPAPGEMSCFADQIVVIDDSEESLFANLEGTAQRAIRKAIRAGVTVVEASSEDEHKEFINMRLDAQERTQQALMPDEFYEDICRGFCATGHCKVLLAKLKGKTIGGVLVLIYKSACSYLAGFGLNAYLDTRYNDLLHWNVILWAKRHGLKYYRLGPYFPDVHVDSVLYKKARFKKKFGGRSFHVLQGSYFLTPDKYAVPTISASQPSCLLPNAEQSASDPNPKPFLHRLNILLRRWGK